MKRFSLWFLSLSRGAQIGILVLTVHLGAVGWLLGHHFLMAVATPPRKPIAVRTTTLPRPAPLVHAGREKAKPLKSTAQLPSTTKPSAPDQELLQQLLNNFEALTAPAPKPSVSAPLSLPSIITTTANPIDVSYGEALLAILQHSLDLPELGEVTLTIEIGPNGTVVNTQVLEAYSPKNSEFLKKRLQELSFPCFNDFGLTEPSMNFTITFRNAEIR